jgi:hypothetical protein
MKILHASILALALLTACQGKKSEPPKPVIDAAPASPHDLHRIVDSDHRNTIHLRMPDKFALPTDDRFDWRAEFEDKTAFVLFVGDAGQGASSAYSPTKTGVTRMMVHGDPKCLKLDGGCGLSKRRWDIIVDVR